MPTSISGDTGVSKVQDGVVTSATIANGSVAQVDLATDVQQLGVGQTWKDMAASRSLGTVYTNTTGKPIQVVVTCAASNALTFSIGGAVVAQATYGSSSPANSVSLIIPNGVTYSVAGSISKWWELR